MKCLRSLAVFILGFSMIFMSVPQAFAEETSDIILKVLVRKGVITQDELNDIRAEIERSKAVADVGAPKSLQERVEVLEEKTKGAIVAVGQGDLKIGGYVQAKYTNYQLDSSSDGFTISNTKISLKGHVTPEVAYKIEIGPHQSSSILYDAYAKLSLMPHTDITVGQFKIPFAKEMLTSSSALDTISRSQMMNSARLANEYGRGIMVSSDDLFGKTLEYYLTVESGRDRNGAEDSDTESFVGRLVFNPFKNSESDRPVNLKGLQIGLSTQVGEQDADATYEGMRERYLGYLKYDLKDVFTDKDYFKIQSEYIYQLRERVGNAGDLKSDGWYILANYKFPARLFDRDMFLEPVFKFEQYDPDKEVSRDREDWYTAGVNLHINKYVKWMTNYVWKEEQSASEVGNNEIVTLLQYKF